MSRSHNRLPDSTLLRLVTSSTKMVKSLWIAGMSVLEPSQNDWLERYDHISSFVPELGAAGLCVDVVRNVQSLESTCRCTRNTQVSATALRLFEHSTGAHCRRESSAFDDDVRSHRHERAGPAARPGRTRRNPAEPAPRRPPLGEDREGFGLPQCRWTWSPGTSSSRRILVGAPRDGPRMSRWVPAS